jgi:putative membrane protein
MRIRLPRVFRAQRTAVVAALTVLGMLATTVAASAPAASTPDAIVDNETVYVVADATGEPKTTVVVDWLQVTGAGSMAIADPAPGTGELESLTDGFAPERAGDDVVATVDVEGTGDFFYRVETTNSLPLEMTMVYFLDGEETAPAELAGKSGRLRMELTLTNLLERTETVRFEGIGGMEESAEVTYTVPLLCIPQFEIDGTKMTALEAPDGAQLAISGSTMTYAVPMMPSPEETAVLEMDARDIELAPLVVSVFPKLPASADFSIGDELVELHDGLGQLKQLSEGHLAVVEGMREGMAAYDVSGVTGAAGGLATLRAGLEQSASGATDLGALAEGQYAYLDGLIASIDTSQFDSIGDLVAGITDMREQAETLETGVAGLVTLVDGQIALLEQIDSLAGASLANAGVLAARYPADVEAQSLAGQLGQLDAMTGALLDGGDLGGGYLPGLPSLRTGLADASGGLTLFRQGLEQFETSSAALTGVPAAFGQLKGALVVLRDGGDPDGPGPAPVMPGLGTTASGLGGLADGLDQAAGGLAAASGDLGMLEEMPGLMADLGDTLDALARGGTLRGQQLPGLDTTVDALGTTVAGLGDGVNDIRQGEALVEAMSAAADAYTSFLGLPKGATGHLTFLFKLDGVSE